jgi:hypothetical protein
MKGKDTFSSVNINELEKLIKLRNITPTSGQKVIRQKMRNIGFYGKDDWGIVNLQIADLHYLIESGKIKVSDNNTNSIVAAPNIPVSITSKIKEPINPTPPLDINSILKDFKHYIFDPQVDNEIKVSNNAGNYILCLRQSSTLPNSPIIPIYTNFEGLKVVYTGIASVSLRTRDYRQHFKGNNAGRSTLRKSLGVLLGYKQIPRDSDQKNGKTKFNYQDEQKLSEWMHSNLIMFALPTTNYNNIEIMLINHFNPPLNFRNNKNHFNLNFRQLLSDLRTLKQF